MPVPASTRMSVGSLPRTAERPRRWRFLKLRYVGLALVVAWGAYDYLYVEKPRLDALSHQQAQLQTHLHRLQQERADLKRQIQELHDKDYIAREATHEFHLVAPGGVPFSVEH
ncbi:FtsB family cell division protein [Alicyclobacillus shizuokensis]|uniref:FtsB family cell division protein n=1 Tax=Alicyclobacillus shizuokensis TaxID=392014 RepID=UPI000ACF229F|nr:septum formation initiator family protein [Alicyclobacillus shizuokensis]